MIESPQSETLHSHITQLLEEQKYEEALPILLDLSEKNPSDRELQTYRLLVIRILVLRWNLSRTTNGKAIQAFAIGQRIIKRLASAVRVPHSTKFSLSPKVGTSVLRAARKHQGEEPSPWRERRIGAGPAESFTASAISRAGSKTFNLINVLTGRM
jgi:hypothetical protein